MAVAVAVAVAVAAALATAVVAGGYGAGLCIPSDSGRIPTEVGQKSPSGKNVKVRSTGMRYNTILTAPVHSSWGVFLVNDR